MWRRLSVLVSGGELMRGKERERIDERVSVCACVTALDEL